MFLNENRNNECFLNVYLSFRYFEFSRNFESRVEVEVDYQWFRLPLRTDHDHENQFLVKMFFSFFVLIFFLSKFTSFEKEKNRILVFFTRFSLN